MGWRTSAAAGHDRAAWEATPTAGFRDPGPGDMGTGDPLSRHTALTPSCPSEKRYPHAPLKTFSKFGSCLSRKPNS